MELIKLLEGRWLSKDGQINIFFGNTIDEWKTCLYNYKNKVYKASGTTDGFTITIKDERANEINNYSGAESGHRSMKLIMDNKTIEFLKR